MEAGSGDHQIPVTEKAGILLTEGERVQPEDLPAVAAAAVAAATAALVLGYVDVEATSVELGTVHFLDRRFGVRPIVERDETETAAATAVAVGDHLDVIDRSEGLKCASKAVICCVPAEATDKKLA